MADAAEVLPLPEEEPANDAPQGDDSAPADQPGKDVSFGTFLTVGPKQYQNVTIVGYDGLRDSVRAVRRSGDSVENIQIPYEQYKTIIEAQKESDKATGRTTKKNLSKVVRGYFGKSVALNGKSAQVIGYDAQSDEVLVNDEGGRRWMKSGEMLGGMQVGRTVTPVAEVAKAKKEKEYQRALEKVNNALKSIDPDLRAELDRKTVKYDDGSIKENVLAIKISHTKNPDIRWRMSWTKSSYVDDRLIPDIKKLYEEKKAGISGQSDASGRLEKHQELRTRAESLLKQIDPKMSVVVARADINYLDGTIGKNVLVLTMRHAEDPSISWNMEFGHGVELEIDEEKLTSALVKSYQEQKSTASAAPSSIREARIELQSERAANAGAATLQSAIAAVVSVAAAIPASDTGAAAVIAAAQNVLAAYGAASETRQNQIQQVSNQLSDTSNRINDLQQRSRQAQAGGNTVQGEEYEVQIVQLQSQRDSLLNQQTDLQVADINSANQTQVLVKAVQQLVPDKTGAVPENKIAAVQNLLPTKVPASPAIGVSSASAATALPIPTKVATPRTYAPGIPSRRSSVAASPSVRTPKPLKPLLGSLSTTSAASRAVQLGADQAYDRGAGFDSSRLSDSRESALDTEGGQMGYSGPLDLPQRKTASYAAGADDEPEPADIYGAAEAAGREEMKRIHGGNTLQGFGQDEQEVAPESRPAPLQQDFDTQAQPDAPTGPTPQELARAAALQQATALTQQQQNQQQGKAGQGAQATAAAANRKKQIESAKKAIANLVDMGNAIHGFADVVGLIGTFAHLNARLVLTIFKKDVPLVPRAGFPYECTAFGLFDLMICISALSMMMGPIIILAAIIATVSGATFGLSELVDLF